MVVKKEYIRVVEHPFTKEEMANLLKEAHNFCKANVKKVYHPIGVRRKRNVYTAPRDQYQACIRDYINKKIQERVGK